MDLFYNDRIHIKTNNYFQMITIDQLKNVLEREGALRRYL